MSTPFQLPAPTALRLSPPVLSMPPLAPPTVREWSPWAPPDARMVVRSNVWPPPTAHTMQWAPPSPAVAEQPVAVTVKRRRFWSRPAIVATSGIAVIAAVAAAILI